MAKKVHKMCLRWGWGLDMIRHVRKDTRGSQEEEGCVGGRMETGSPWRGQVSELLISVASGHLDDERKWKGCGGQGFSTHKSPEEAWCTWVALI